MTKHSVFHAVGLMSGTSLDGLDIAYCRFERTIEGWHWKLLAADCAPWPVDAMLELGKLQDATALEFARADKRYGRAYGNLLRSFLERTKISRVDLVASHGHTIFHQPGSGLTTQLGSGAVLSAACGYPVVSDFRTQDVAHGGQGAPLVPIGDRHLFGQYEACLNLGGISNISYEHEGKRIAFDVGPANIVLNPIAKQLGRSYDEDGARARSGKLLPELLAALNALPYYQQAAPKSLGREWMETNINPLLPANANPHDLLHTCLLYTSPSPRDA